MAKVRIGFLVLLAVLVLAMAIPGQAAEFRALWVDSWHTGFENATATQTTVDYSTGSNCNAVIVEMRKRGDAYYTSTLEPKGVSITPAAGYDSLADICTKAHAAGLEVYAWVVMNRVWTSQTAPATTTPNHVYNTHPEWFSLNDSGSKFDADNNSFLDPGVPGVEDWNKSVVMQIVSNYDVDGVILDYIRYPSTHWGYNTTAVSRYNTEYGLSGNPTYSDTQWSNWRRDQVTNMVKRVYLEAKAAKPGIKIGAAVWNLASTGNSSYFQNWDAWMSGHILDFASPMAYTSTNTTWNTWVNDAYNRKYGRHIYIAQAGYLNTISNSMTQISYAQAKPLDGVTPYNYNTPNSGTADKPGFQSALVSGPFATPQSVPTMSWITSPTYGMLKGFVKDSSGNAIYPATVTISTKSTKNSGTGFYGFVDLTPGTYTLTATTAGGDTVSRSVTITAGQVTTADLNMVDDIIIDNTSATYTGSWLTGTSSTDKYGTDYRYLGTQATETGTAIWRPTIPVTGTYDVYAWYPQGTNRSIKAPFTVSYSGGSVTANVDQTVNGGRWNLIASKKQFAAGTTGYVKLGNGTAETSKVVMADAVKFVYAP